MSISTCTPYASEELNSQNLSPNDVSIQLMPPASKDNIEGLSLNLH